MMTIYPSEFFTWTILPDSTPEDILKLITKHVQDYGVTRPLPQILYVDPPTYGRCCQAIFDWMKKSTNTTNLSLGPNNGLMFKGIELVIDDK